MQAPATLPSDQPPELRDLFVRILVDITDRVLPEMVGIGVDMWGGLAIIMLVYVGLGVALNNFSAQKMIALVLMILFARVLLYYYDSPLFSNMTFPMAIIAGGSWFQDLFLGNAAAAIFQELMDAVGAIWAGIIADWKSMNILSLMISGPHVVMQTFILSFLSFLTLLMVGLVWVIVTAQLLMAMLILAVYVLLGPICIPFLVTPPLNFFFWGWFKALLKYTLYGAVAGALLAVFSGVGTAYLRTVTTALLTPGGGGFEGITDLFSWTLATAIFFSVGLMAAFKVDEVASSIVGGAGPSGAGMLAGAAGAAATLATGGGAAVLRGATGAGGAKALKAAAPTPSLL